MGKMENSKVSNFTLERYRLGELLPEDRKALENAFAMDENIRSRIIFLDESDRELRKRYPVEFFDRGVFQALPDKLPSSRPARLRIPGRGKRLLAKAARLPMPGKIAAGILLCLTLPLVFYLRVQNQAGAHGMSDPVYETFADRAKGAVLSHAEFSVYLKGESEILLGDQAVLAEGNTVQLAYTTPVGEFYGVIFSIDGRSEVTMHYPYRRGQSSVLVPGRRTFLSEAYTLDDAPFYEIFVMVVSEKPLNVEAVLREAQGIAKTEDLASVDLRSDEGKKQVFSTRAVFDGCDVETVKVIKK
jgi:hypothetical protein